MIVDIIAIIIGLSALVVVLIILFRKFQVLSSIDTKTVPEEKASKVKKDLLEGRLKRKVMNISSKVKETASPYYEKGRKKAGQWYNKVIEMENKYRESKKKVTPITLEDKEKATSQINDKLREAEDLKNSGNLKAAEEKCIEVVGLDQKNIEAYHLLGDLYLEMKDYEHAKEIFSFLIKFNAQDDKAYEGLGQIASSLGDLDEAKNDLLKSININSKIATYHSNLAKVYEAMDKVQDAIKSYQDALMLEPNNPKHLNGLLQLTILAKNKSLAIRTFDKLKEVNPENERLDELEKEVNNI